MLSRSAVWSCSGEPPRARTRSGMMPPSCSSSARTRCSTPISDADASWARRWAAKTASCAFSVNLFRYICLLPLPCHQQSQQMTADVLLMLLGDLPETRLLVVTQLCRQDHLDGHVH